MASGIVGLERVGVLQLGVGLLTQAGDIKQQLAMVQIFQQLIAWFLTALRWQRVALL